MYNNPLSYVVALFSVVVALLSSKFARQVVLLAFILISISLLSYKPLVILLSAYLLCILIRGKFFIVSFKEGLLYPLNVIRKIRNKKIELSSFVELRHFIHLVRRFRFKDLIYTYKAQEPIRAILFYPELLILLGLYIYLGIHSGHGVAGIFSIVIILLYIITSTSYFNFIGEGFRYIEYGLYYFIPFQITKLFFTVNNKFIFLDLFLIIMFISIMLLNSIRKKEFKLLPDSDTLTDFLKPLNLSKNNVVLALTRHLANEFAARSTSKVVRHQPGEVKKDYYDKFYGKAPYVSNNISMLISSFGVTHIIYKSNDRNLNQFQLDNYEIVKSDQYYTIRKV